MDARLDPDARIATSFLARGLSSNGCAAILPAVSRVRRLAGIADLGANECCYCYKVASIPLMRFSICISLSSSTAYNSCVPNVLDWPCGSLMVLAVTSRLAR